MAGTVFCGACLLTVRTGLFFRYEKPNCYKYDGKSDFFLKIPLTGRKRCVIIYRSQTKGTEMCPY